MTSPKRLAPIPAVNDLLHVLPLPPVGRALDPLVPRMTDHNRTDGVVLLRHVELRPERRPVLLGDTEGQCSEPLGVDFYRVDVVAGNERAADLYEALGFEVAERVYERTVE